MGGVPELVRHEREALLVPPTAEGLERGIQRLLDDADLRRAMGTAGRLRATERFSTPHAVRRHLEIYRGELER